MSLQYRPEIDGLRAIAVSSVLIYHAEFQFGQDTLLEGGFLGVDIFFVLSGYLISRIIFSALLTGNSLSIVDFYDRRIRRILPALLVVIIVSTPLAWILLAPSDLEEFAGSIVSSIFSYSNIFFYFSTTEYGADSSLLKPFMHTWSLSVEEQFYLFFPLIAIWIYKGSNIRALTTYAFIIVSSLSVSHFLLFFDTSLNFFISVTRFWELAVGSLLAFYELRWRTVHGHSWIGAVGFALVLLSIASFSASAPHPSVLTAVPVLGVALVLLFGSSATPLGRILSIAPLRWIGLVSYSAYLWHFPLMAFGRIAFPNATNIDKLLWIAMTFFLSVLTYFAIEVPFRNRRLMSASRVYPVLAIQVALILGGAILVDARSGFPERVPDQVRQENFDDRVRYQSDFQRCHKLAAMTGPADQAFCKWGNFPSNVYLVGDSHMVALAFDLRAKLLARGQNLILMTRPGSAFGKNPQLDKMRMTQLARARNDVVILGGYLHRESDEFFEGNRSAYEELVSDLLSRGNKVVFVYPIPSTYINRASLFQEYVVNGYLKDVKSSRNDFENSARKAYRFLDGLGGLNVYRVYPESVLCDDLFCYGIRGNEILISDFDHPSTIASGFINDQLLLNLE